jgi:hypothetical protein
MQLEAVFVGKRQAILRTPEAWWLVVICTVVDSIFKEKT